MLRSLQSTQRERFSSDDENPFVAGLEESLGTRTAYMKPLQAAFTSIAAQFSPSSLASIGADAGHSRSGVVVAITGSRCHRRAVRRLRWRFARR